MDISKLTKRQRQIFDLLVDGCSDKEIAAQIGISQGGVSSHLQQINRKLGFINRRRMVVQYYKDIIECLSAPVENTSSTKVSCSSRLATILGTARTSPAE